MVTADRQAPPLTRRATPLAMRHALLARLAAEGTAPVVIVSAPAGSGKSTLLTQWTSQDPRAVAWVSLAPVHADPVHLLDDLAQAIAAGLPDGPVAALLPRLGTPDAMRNQALLSKAMTREPQGAVIVLDDLHQLRGSLASIDLVTSLADRLADGWTIAFAVRGGVDLPTTRWLMEGRLLTLGYEDLALDRTECGHLLASLGVTATDAMVDGVLARTEGWAAGVYLAGLALRADRLLPGGPLVAGDDALVRSYLDTEVLGGIDRADRELLVRTSIVEEISAPLAEWLTGDGAAAERLYRIAGENLLVSAVDRDLRWFRCHSLLRERLQRELHDRSGAAGPLHARASAWYAANGRPAEAVTHAIASGDDALAERLVIEAIQGEYRGGRVERIRRWLAAFPEQAFVHNLELALTAAWFAALEGATEQVARWSAITGVDRTDELDAAIAPGGMDAWMVRAMLAPGGPELMLEDAQRSLAQHDASWRWSATAEVGRGAAHLMLGDRAAAMAAFEAAERTHEAHRAAARLAGRAERASDAINRHAWAEAERILATDRRVVMDDPGGARIVGPLWLCVDARLSLHRGDRLGAQERLRRAQIGRARLTWAIPWLAVRSLTLMAQVQLLVGDSVGARAAIAQARDVQRLRPDLGVLGVALDEVAERSRQAPDSGSRMSALSPAELRLLPFLQTHLTFKEIGQRLSITGNTVKSEAMSIYAKLEATSRSEAVERAVDCGLLEDAFA